MRTIININKDWLFFKEEVPLDKAFDGAGIRLDLPYTWNGEDGQDGKDDYFRGVCTFAHRFHAPASEKGGKVYLEFKGVILLAEFMSTANSSPYITVDTPHLERI